MQIIKTDSTNEDFIGLVRLLDRELAVYNGEQNDFYSQFNTIAPLKNVVVLYIENHAVACGAFKPWDDHTVEIKRMYVKEDHRKKGYAGLVLEALEKWAFDLDCTNATLETGTFLPGTVALYTKSGYHIIPNYGQYVGVEGSVCMGKKLIP